MDSDDEDDEDYSSDQPRKRQRTASRKSLSAPSCPSEVVLIRLPSLKRTHTSLPLSQL